MTREEMVEGLRAGRRLCQEEWADANDIVLVDSLVAEGIAVATPFRYNDNFQCERRYVTAAPAKIEHRGDKP